MSTNILKRLDDLISWLFDSEVPNQRKIDRSARILFTAAQTFADADVPELFDAAGTARPAAQGAALYDECRDAYEDIARLCGLIHSERLNSEFDAEKRNQAARKLESHLSSDRLRNAYIALLDAEDPWLAALSKLEPLVRALRERTETLVEAAAQNVKQSDVLSDPSLAHVRAEGIRGAQTWLKDELEVRPPGTKAPLDTQVDSIVDIIRIATFLPSKSREAWKINAANARQRFALRTHAYRSLVAAVEYARRANRLETALAKLAAWIASPGSAAPPGKARKEGVTEKFRSRLDAAENCLDALQRAENMVDVLYDWATAGFTKLRVALPASVAALSLAFTANVVSRQMTAPSSNVLNAGWDFFDLSHPERLAALFAIVAVVALFFLAQLESVRRYARMLGAWAVGGFAILSLALPVAAGRAAMTIHSESGKVASPALSEEQKELVAKGYDCRAGYRPTDRLSDLIVLTCTNDCKAMEGNSIYLPRERLEALEVSGGGVCFKFLSSKESKKEPSLDSTGLADLAAAIRDAPPQVLISIPDAGAGLPSKLASSIDHLGSALQTQKGNFTLDMSKETLATVQRLSDEAQNQEQHRHDESTQLARSLARTQWQSAAELELANCRQSERRKTSWWEERKLAWRGAAADDCYEVYLRESRPASGAIAGHQSSD